MKEFFKKTGEEVRWDWGKGDGEGHWHRINLDKSTQKKFPYLDPNGKHVKKDSPDGHIKPNPRTVPDTFLYNIPMAKKFNDFLRNIC